MALALEGIKVVDLSQVAAVPMAAQHLADFGAEVIHIENPVTGDYWRRQQVMLSDIIPAIESDVNCIWQNYNRNKKSMTLNIAPEDGQEIVYRLVKQADVFLTNLRPFELEKYNLEYDTLNQLNSRLIFGNLTGYGKEGADKDNPAYDNVAHWARSGIAYRMTPVGARPTNGLGAFGDNVAGMSLFAGVMTALYVREKTGMGQKIDISLFHTGVYQQAMEISGTLVTGKDLMEEARALYQATGQVAVNPLVITYQTKDERWFLVHMLQPEKYWPDFCRAVGREDLLHDPRFESFEARAENNIALFQILEEVFQSKTLAEWKSRMAGIPASPVQNHREVTADPQARTNGFYTTVEHPVHRQIDMLANPVKLSTTPATIRTPAPEFGQHTEEVLLEYGYTWDDIGQFKEQGVIA